MPSRPTPGPGALDRDQLAAFEGLLGRTGGSRAILVGGTPSERGIVAVGLAAAAAAAGRRTALVECDLDAPSLAARLGLADGPGLGDYLRDEAEPGEILQPLVVAGPAGGRAREPLVCVVAGAADGLGRPADLLRGEAFAHAVAKLRNAYELVVLEGPPFSDAEAFVAAVRHVDFSLAADDGDLPADLRDHIDGSVDLSPARPQRS